MKREVHPRRENLSSISGYGCSNPEITSLKTFSMLALSPQTAMTLQQQHNSNTTTMMIMIF
jgi:hypothetical protein